MKTRKLLDAGALSRAYWGHHDVDIKIIDGQAYACNNNRWNGEAYNEAWQLDENYKVVNECCVCGACEEVKKDEIPEELLEELEEDGDIAVDYNTEEDITYSVFEDKDGNLRYYKHYFEVDSY